MCVCWNLKSEKYIRILWCGFVWIVYVEWEKKPTAPNNKDENDLNDHSNKPVVYSVAKQVKWLLLENWRVQESLPG